MRRLLILCCWLLSLTTASAQDSTRVFTQEHPLVYEDAWDLWPYAFLNENGEAVGYNIDVLKLIFERLGIPYVVRLKPTQDALNDLKAGRAELMCGMEAHFHNDYAQYGKSVIQIFTHSVLHDQDEEPVVKTVEDLARHSIIVHSGSFSHHIMQKYGWGKNAIPYDDMREAVQKVHNDPGKQILWNTLSLKWLIQKLQYDDLILSPVNIPHGEYKFMSNNPRLLQQIDSVFTDLNSSGRLQDIQNKWFYPERTETGIPSWIWYIVNGLLVMAILAVAYLILYKRYEMRMTRSNRKRMAQVEANSRKLQQANDEISRYVRSIDYALQYGGVRMANYSPDSRSLVIYSGVGTEQYRLTQTRSLRLIDNESRADAENVFNLMDNRSHLPIEATVMTNIRLKAGYRLCLYLSFIPTIDAEGRATEYYGLCRDISELKATEHQLALETEKAQTVETVKNAFLRNMSYEIRTPLTSVVGFAELFDHEHDKDDEAFFIDQIRNNSERLLELINDILFLSRLDAEMIEFKTAPVDIAAVFERRCQDVWSDHEHEGVTLVTESPYERLVVEIDESNIGHVLDRLVTRAALATTEGEIRASYDYTGQELVITVESTDGGMSEEAQQHVFDRFVMTNERGTGLEMNICHELMTRMGGKIRIMSNADTGTVVRSTIPCQCQEAVKKGGAEV